MFRLTTQVRGRLASRAAIGLAVAGATLAASVIAIAPANAATATDCTQWGTTSISGGAYIYQQNEWNSTTQQCAAIDTTTGAFSLTSANFNLATNGAPATYPSIFKGCHWGACTSNSGLPIRVSALGTATTSWSTTQPGSGAYDVAYDLWFNSTPTTTGQPDGTEVMIWLNSRGGVQPFGTKTASASISGKQWDVWTGQQTSWKIISYVLVPGATSFAGLDAKALISDAVARGSINPAHYLIDAEAGFEVWQGGQGLASNSFSFSATTGTGGGGDTTAPSVPAGLRVSATTSSSVALAWTASTDAVGVTGYDVYRAGALVGSATGTSFTDTGLSASTAYSYTVRARDAAGNVSAASAAVTGTTAAAGNGAGSGGLKVRYKNNDSNPTDNAIGPGLQLVNTGTTALNLSTATARYYFTRDAGSPTVQAWCDYAVLGSGTIRLTVVPLSSSVTGADAYLEVGFTSGTLAPGASTGDIQLRMSKADWSPFNEVNDYSRGTSTAYVDSPTVPAYLGSTLAWGTAPS